MPRRLIAFAALAFALAAVFVRLGFWQLSRLEERRAFNALRARPLAEPAVPLDSLGAPTPYRWVTVVGEPDFAHEIVVSGRSRNGSPGVHVLTPFRMQGRDTAVMVLRGWVYSPDAATVDLSRFRETLGGVRGYTDTLSTGPSSADQGRPRTLRRLNRSGIAALLPYPVSSVLVVAQDSAPAAAPARLPLPELSDGPHLGYAIQWFAFALTAVGGAGIVLYRAGGRRAGGSTGAKTVTRQS